jgi:hypothetical protein
MRGERSDKEMSENLRGELKRRLGVTEDGPVDESVVFKCACWMRTRFELHEQAWFREQIRNVDKAETVVQLLEAIEDIYTAKLIGRPGMRREVIDEMMLNLPPILF